MWADFGESHVVITIKLFEINSTSAMNCELFNIHVYKNDVQLFDKDITFLLLVDYLTCQ